MKCNKIFIFVFVLFFSFETFAQKKEIAYKGVIDLRKNVDLNKDVIDLSGEWEFFWNKLLTPSDFDSTVFSPDAYFKIPGSWTGLKINGKEIPDTGFATLRLVLFLPDTISEGTFSILIPEVMTSYKLWINDKLAIREGKIGESSNTSEPAVSFRISSIGFKPGRNQIIIQLSNYYHRVNGFDEAPIFGKTEKVVQYFTKRVAYDFIAFGFALILAIYHIGLFIMRSKNKAALSFAFVTLLLSIRFLFTDVYVATFMFNRLTWKTTYFIGYLTYYLIVPAVLYFFRATFEDKKFKFFYYIAYTFSLIFILTLLLPSIIYTKVLFIYQFFTLFVIVFAVFLIIRNVRLKKSGARILLFTSILLFLTAINDILYFNKVIHTFTMLPFGTFILIIGQSIALARKFTKAFTDNEALTEQLDYQNKNLHKIVKERTKEIEEQKEDILMKNEELMMQKEELETQKNQIEEQKKIIEEHIKLMTDSITYASTIQQAILPKGENLQKYFDLFVLFLPKDIVSGDFYWHSDTSKDYIFFALGDCTGHGVPGAFLSLIGSYLLNNVVNEKQIYEPSEILENLDKRFKKYLNVSKKRNFDGMDISIVRFEKADRTKVLFSAAKSNILVYDALTKELTRIRGTRRSIGNIMDSKTAEKIQFKTIGLNLSKSTTIYLYSDGYIDQNDLQRKRYGTKRFVNFIRQIAELPVQQQKIKLLKELEDFRQEEPQRDDITVVGLKIKS